jgi:hypothetical protein
VSCCSKDTGTITVWASSSYRYLASASPEAVDMQEAEDRDKATKNMPRTPGLSSFDDKSAEKRPPLWRFFDSLVRQHLFEAASYVRFRPYAVLWLCRKRSLHNARRHSGGRIAAGVDRGGRPACLAASCKQAESGALSHRPAPPRAQRSGNAANPHVTFQRRRRPDAAPPVRALSRARDSGRARRPALERSRASGAGRCAGFTDVTAPA